MSWMNFATYYNLKQPGSALSIQAPSSEIFFSYVFSRILDSITWFWKISQLTWYYRRPRLGDGKTINLKEINQWKTDISFLFSASWFTDLLDLMCIVWCRQGDRNVNSIKLHLCKRVTKVSKLWPQRKTKGKKRIKRSRHT